MGDLPTLHVITFWIRLGAIVIFAVFREAHLRRHAVCSCGTLAEELLETDGCPRVEGPHIVLGCVASSTRVATVPLVKFLSDICRRYKKQLRGLSTTQSGMRTCRIR